MSQNFAFHAHFLRRVLKTGETWDPGNKNEKKEISKMRVKGDPWMTAVHWLRD